MEILNIILTSLLSGVLLNFMPCVLPLIGIKLQGFYNIQSKKDVQLLCIFTSLGIMFFMLLMTGVFQIIKQLAGVFYWGFQLQNPFFISFLLFVMMFLTFTLVGKINFNPQVNIANFKSAKMEGFVSGFLIVVFSISCTAPVIGSAIAFASVLNFNLWVVMFFMGVGLCIPYLLFTLFPQFVLKINKNKRVGRFIKAASFILMLATIGFLSYILASLSNILITTLVLILMLIGIFAYIKTSKSLILVGTQVLIVMLILFQNSSVKSEINQPQVVPFTEARLNNFLSKGNTVIINFDASWCINCKGNNLLAFGTDEFKAYIKQHNIIFMKGDVSLKDPTLENFMARFQVFAVPFTVIFSPKYPNGKVLPIFLTTQILIKEIEKYGF